jgi:hypothetical protein
VSYLSGLATSPTHSGNMILIIIGAVVLLVLVLTIIIEIKTQHFDLITNALLIIFLIVGFYLLNLYISHSSQNTETTFTEFSAENKN